jgi:hypothetical protein
MAGAPYARAHKVVRVAFEIASGTGPENDGLYGDQLYGPHKLFKTPKKG